MSNVTPEIKIVADTENLDFVLTTNFNTNRIIFKCEFGELVLPAGWQPISAAYGFTQSDLADTLADNTYVAIEQLMDLSKDLSPFGVDVRIFKDTKLTDFSFNEIAQSGDWIECDLVINLSKDAFFGLAKVLADQKDRINVFN